MDCCSFGVCVFVCVCSFFLTLLLLWVVFRVLFLLCCIWLMSLCWCLFVFTGVCCSSFWFVDFIFVFVMVCLLCVVVLWCV